MEAFMFAFLASSFIVGCSLIVCGLIFQHREDKLNEALYISLSNKRLVATVKRLAKEMRCQPEEVLYKIGILFHSAEMELCYR